MATPVSREQSFFDYFKGPEPLIQSDIVESVIRTAFTLYMAPIKFLFTEGFPRIGGWIYNYPQIQEPKPEENLPEPGRSAQARHLSPETRNELFARVNALKKAAGLESKRITLCKGGMDSFHSFGGPWSLGAPVVCIPGNQLTRADKTGFGDKGSPQEGLFNNNQTTFLIARQLGYIANNHSLLRVAIRTLFFASGFFSLFGPVGFLIHLAVTGISLIGLIMEESYFQGRMDQVGVEILAQTYGITIQCAAQIGIRTLEKMQEHNKQSLRENPKLRWCISEEGDNCLDMTAPPLTQRIEALKLLKTPSQSEQVLQDDPVHQS